MARDQASERHNLDVPEVRPCTLNRSPVKFDVRGMPYTPFTVSQLAAYHRANGVLVQLVLHGSKRCLKALAQDVKFPCQETKLRTKIDSWQRELA